MDLNRVSVIIPSYNRRSLLVEAVDSVLAQTHPAFEVLVGDDGSTDGTSELLRERYGDRIRVERLPRNRGRSAARNHGWQTATGNLVAFLDSDDRWLPRKLEVQVPLFDDPDVGLVHAYVGKMDLAGCELARETEQEVAAFREAAPRGYEYDGITETWCRMYTSAVVIRREVLERSGGFDERLNEFEDWDLFWRVALLQRVATAAEVLTLHRVHPGNSHSTWEASAGPWRLINEKHLSILERYAAAPFFRRARRNLQVNLALSSFWGHDRRDSRRWMLRALRTDPSLLARPFHYTYATPLLYALFPEWIARRLVLRACVDPYPGSVTVVIDDGPSESTAQLLDLLEKAGHRAILFVQGRNVTGREAVLESAIRRGFALGNHSFSHARFSEISLADARLEISKTEAIIERLYAKTGVERQARWFRFPYLDSGGAKREQFEQLLNELGFAGHFDSTLLTGDWSLPAADDLRRRIRRASPGAVIELHDNQECVRRYAGIVVNELRRLRLRAALPARGSN